MECNLNITKGDFASKFISEYSAETLPKLQEITSQKSYDIIFDKFIEQTKNYLKEIKKISNKITQKEEKTVSEELVIKSERESINDCVTLKNETNKRQNETEIIENNENNIKKVKRSKSKKSSKKLVKTKKTKKKNSEICDTTADMVRKNQSCVSTVSLDISITKKKIHKRSTVNTSTSKISKKLKKKSTLLKKNSTQLIKNSECLSSLDILENSQRIPKPIATSSIASYSVKSEPFVVTQNLEIKNNICPKTPGASNVCQSQEITASGKVKQMTQMFENRIKTPSYQKPGVKNTPLQSNTRINLNGSNDQSKSVSRNLNLQYLNIQKSAIKPGLSTQQNDVIKSKAQSTYKPKNTNQGAGGVLKNRLSARIEQKRNSLKNVDSFLKSVQGGNDNNCNKLVVPKREPTTAAKRLFTISNNPVVKNNYKIQGKIGGNVGSKLTVPTIHVHPPTSKRTSFCKFLERNTTPSKLTTTELKLKEEIEKKRLEERDKIQQEKIEISKKKREEKLKKINEIKAKKAEMELKRHEELESKLKEAEENKKRQFEENKKRIVEEKKREKERFEANQNLRYMQMPKSPNAENAYSKIQPSTYNNCVSTFQSHKVGDSAKVNPQMYKLTNLNHIKQEQQQGSNIVRTETYKHCNTPQKFATSVYDTLSTFKSNQGGENTLIKANKNTPLKHNYILPQICSDYKSPMHVIDNQKTPLSTFKAYSQSNSHTKHGTPVVKPKTYENYNVNDLKSEDETDDDEEPSKPIPQWAKNPQLINKVQTQSLRQINFTKLFDSTSDYNIVLENIFKIKRKNFAERTSSAVWNSPPVWRTNGLTGNEFKQT